MNTPAQNLSLGSAVDFTIDPTIPQSGAQAVRTLNDATNAQVALNQATDLNQAARTGGSSRRRRRYGSKKGGDPNTIVVAPLPLGADTANAQANNVAAATLFADAVSASKFDSAVTKVGGKRRRLSKKRTQKRRRTKRRSTKYRKMRKGKKSRRTRRR